MKPSEKLQELMAGAIGERAGLAFVERISADPFIAVGISPSEEKSWLVLLLPPNVIQSDVTLERIICKRSTRFEYKGDDGEQVAIVAGSIFFDAVTPAVEIVLDSIAEALATEKQRAGELAQDFIELFKPGRNLSADELIGLFGELTVISKTSDSSAAVSMWHEEVEGRYDFSSSSSRLEIKTTLGSARTHHFSSNQLPPRDAVEVLVGSVLTEIVQDGTSVVDLWRLLQARMKTPLTRAKLDRLVLRTVSKGHDLASETSFDFDLATSSLIFFSADQVPTPILTEGVISASWEANLEGLHPTDPVVSRVNDAIKSICSPAQGD
jgi:hypothetical protein